MPKRFIVRDFLIGSPILVDRKTRTLYFYSTNLYGQVYDLKNPKSHIVTKREVSGLIQRSNSMGYGMKTAKVIDAYICKYLMTPEEKAQCPRVHDIPAWNTLIAEKDNYSDAIYEMCEWVFENENHSHSDKEVLRPDLLRYCHTYLAQNPVPPVPAKTEKVR